MERWISTLVLSITFVQVSQAQSTSEQHLTVALEGTPVSQFWSHHTHMQMDIHYGDDPSQRLDIYTQGRYVGSPGWFKRSSGLQPTFVWIHGGGWRFGNKETDAWFFTHFLERGWNVVNVEYRRGLKTAPAAAEDILSVMKWIRNHAAEYHFDTDNIVVSGASAGGHLALLAGLVNSKKGSHPNYVGDDIRIRAIINWYGVTDLQLIDEYLRQEMPNNNFVSNWLVDDEDLETISDHYSPVNYITKHAPPVLTIQGDQDKFTPYSQAIYLHELLDQAKVENKLLTLYGGRHLDFTEDQFQLIFKTIFEFINTHK
ncbi:MAG: alpha/beta hydrolase [Bacteroidota bacterium]